MDPLLDILQRFPKCRVTITSRPYRKQPYEGQLRVLARKGRMIRRQQVVYGRDGRIQGYCVRNGRPRWEWMSESSLKLDEIARYAARRAEKGDPQ